MKAIKLRAIKAKTIKTKRADTYDPGNSNEKNILNLYIAELSRLPLLSKEDEEKYARQAARGNKYARERLINSNLRFVISIAKKYQGKGLPLEDLISEGNVGLLNAVEHFDIEKGYRFITYAVWWIRQAIIRALQEKVRMIRLPTNKTNELKLIDKTKEIINRDSGWTYEKEIREIATFLEMSISKTEELLHIGQDTVSLDDLVSANNDLVTVKDLIPDDKTKAPDDYAINNNLKDDLEELMDSCLEGRSAEVIRSRFGIGNSVPKTLKEIGDLFNLSRERVRQIEILALKRLRKSPEHKVLEPYTA